MAIDFIWYCTKTAAETQSVLDQLVENNKELLNKRFLIYSADEIFEVDKKSNPQVYDVQAYRNESNVVLAKVRRTRNCVSDSSSFKQWLELN